MLDFKNIIKYKTYLIRIGNRCIFNDQSQGVLVKNVTTFTDDQLIAIQKNWDETEVFNLAAAKHNEGLREKSVKQIEEFFSDLGMPTWAKNNSGTVIGQHAEFKTMMKQMDIMMGGPNHCPKRPMVHSVFSLNEHIKPLVKTETLLDFVNEVRPLIAEQERQKQELDDAKVADRQAMAAAILSHAKDRNAVEKSRREWIKANIPNGKTVKIVDCNYCDEWRIGSFKCSCGRTYMNFKVVGEPGNWEIKMWGEPDPIMNVKIS
jgi:hypothetical protein